MMPKKPKPIERRYAITSLGKGTGKYVLYSNDGCHAYVIARYDEHEGTGAEPTYWGTWWRTLRIKPDSGLVTYDGTPGRSKVTGIADPERIADAAADLDTTVLVEVEEQLPTRNAAIQAALTRYVVRQHALGRHDFWGVHDTVQGGWPALIAGRKIHDTTTNRAEAEADADWLNRNHA